MSSNQAKSYHSITIGTKNTWDDWHLVCSSRPVINPPPVKSGYMAVTGGDGYYDLTESLAGRPTYGNRTGSWEFIVVNPGQLPSTTAFTGWTALYSGIMDYLQGKKLNVILDDEPTYYYTGRLSVTEWASEPGNSKITISYSLDPYKRQVGHPSNKML